MRCMHCDQDTSVIDTRAQGDGTIRRKRRCAAGHVFMTWESTANAQRLRENQRKAQRAYRERNPGSRKRTNLRRAARLEAQETGEPVETVYERYGVK